ncbi:MAG: amino acid adenylation domain-containing protein [Nitrospirae bacterium]|nr:amino acid adenylation domain-containing protein [Nitrospirota bacterium]
MFVSNLAIAFESVVEEYPDRPALIYPDIGSVVTYRELAILATRIAGALHVRGVRKGEVVALFHDKSPAAFAAMLACLRLGITYTNLDPDSPRERLRKILQTCQPRLIINAFTELPHTEVILAEHRCEVIDLCKIADAHCEGDLPDSRNIGGGTPAYIMFTSGSTGTPKGAVISHANLIWFSAWSRDRFAITSEDVLTNVNPIYFDNSVSDFYSAVFSGAALVPFTPVQVKDPRRLIRLVNQALCTIWFSVPSLLVYLLTTRAIAVDDFPAVRKIIFGGEGFPKVKLKQLYDLFGARADLENVYGPTECTCICSAHTIGPADFDDMKQVATLGSLAQNFEGEILPQDESHPDFGELFLRGPQVGLGYYNDPGLTARSFIQNPHHAQYQDIGYRTGDLVQRDAQGRLHFKGRADFQIKHMGYRIELEEIEVALSTLTGVAECAVIYQRLGDGLGEILGFAAMPIPEASEQLVDKMRTIIPSYMLPRRIYVLEFLPKNANGKIDRLALHRLVEKETAQ